MSITNKSYYTIACNCAYRKSTNTMTGHSESCPSYSVSFEKIREEKNVSDNKEAAAKELEIRKRIEQAQAGERFAAYRRGWQDGTSIRPVLEFVKWQEDYNHGYVAGRQELRNTMNKKRRDYGLPAEKTVHIA